MTAEGISDADDGDQGRDGDDAHSAATTMTAIMAATTTSAAEVAKTRQRRWKQIQATTSVIILELNLERKHKNKKINSLTMQIFESRSASGNGRREVTTTSEAGLAKTTNSAGTRTTTSGVGMTATTSRAFQR
jgi:hypothetical protein